MKKGGIDGNVAHSVAIADKLMLLRNLLDYHSFIIVFEHGTGMYQFNTLITDVLAGARHLLIWSRRRQL